MFNHNHVIKCHDTRILSTVPSYTERLTREVVELELNPNNMNREDGLTLSGSWKPLFRLRRDSTWPPQWRWLAYGPFRGPYLYRLSSCGNGGFFFSPPPSPPSCLLGHFSSCPSLLRFSTERLYPPSEFQFYWTVHCSHQWRTGGGGLGCSNPPRNSEGLPQLCQTQLDLRKLLKIAEFRTPTSQDVWKKAVKF
jgi:hypothetical protein